MIRVGHLDPLLAPMQSQWRYRIMNVEYAYCTLWPNWMKMFNVEPHASFVLRSNNCCSVWDNNVKVNSNYICVVFKLMMPIDIFWCIWSIYCVPFTILHVWHANNSSQLTHWGRDKMAAVSQTTLSDAFSWMKMLEFRLRFHWSLFLRVMRQAIIWTNDG